MRTQKENQLPQNNEMKAVPSYLTGDIHVRRTETYTTRFAALFQGKYKN